MDIEQQIHSTELAGITRRKGDIFPDYAGYSICNIPPMILSLFGDQTGNNTLTRHLTQKIDCSARRVVLIIIDGLGYYHLQEHLRLFPDLYFHQLIKNGMMLPLTSVFPSTTAAALPTYSTGATPEEHGILGYRLYLKEIGAITNMIKMSVLGNTKGDSALDIGIDVEKFLGLPTLYQRLAPRGVNSHVFLSRHIQESGLSHMLYRGTDSINFIHSSSDMLVQVRRLLQRTRTKMLINIYWGMTDTIAHTYGPQTEEFTAELRSFAASLERELSGRIEDTLLLICSDHGFATVGRSDYIDITEYPKLTDALFLPPVGDARAAYLYTKPGQEEAAARFIKQNLPVDLLCLQSQDALQSGLFGLGQTKPETIDRIGNLIVISTGATTLNYPYTKGLYLKGMHGGITENEMIVPLIACSFE
ncbi:alkaline phosphatase family protein [Candidatus Acetothermia bacterium]|jgi:predicted AlkP superfamily pyrophosphatase or phosphodiesterase|nr:alkaline phosphatase family protein [Candidatus Acetothermia bacterium]MCI2427672.1 alkaline phosphatase family protein [Candidatus Acetothermia bacterium]MCI2428373.1 alkaline phosphatase family protein [Candidatus Acetothermia bacterium]